MENREIEWSDNIQSTDELRDEIAFQSWDIAILDSRLWWRQEAEELIGRFSIEVLYFDGDFVEIANQVQQRLPVIDEKEEEFASDELHDIDPKDPDENEDGPVRYIEKKVIEREEIRVEVEVPVKTYASIPNKLCFFLSLSPRSGATFIASNLAAAIATRQLFCTLLESPKSRVSLYDLLNVAMKKEDYESPFKYLEKQGFFPKGRDFFYNGVSFLLNHPGYTPQVGYESIIKLLYQIRSSICLFDISSSWNNEDMLSLLPEADHIFLVIDPEPALVERMAPPEGDEEPTPECQLVNKLIELRKQKQVEAHFLINKDNEGVDHQVLKDLPFKPLVYIPYFSPDQLYRSSWKGELLYQTQSDEIEDALFPILKEIIPQEYLYIDKVEKTNFLHKIKSLKEKFTSRG